MKKEKNIEKVAMNPQLKNMLAIERRRMRGRKSVQLQVTDVLFSPQKMEDILKLIRRLDVVEAQNQLRYLNKRHSHTVLRILNDMVEKAQKEHGLHAEDLFVDLAFPTKGRTVKGIIYHAKGRAGRKQRRACHVNITLVQKERTPDAILADEEAFANSSELSEQERHDAWRWEQLDKIIPPLKFREKLSFKEKRKMKEDAKKDEYYPEGAEVDASGMRI